MNTSDGLTMVVISVINSLRTDNYILLIVMLFQYFSHYQSQSILNILILFSDPNNKPTVIMRVNTVYQHARERVRVSFTDEHSFAIDTPCGIAELYENCNVTISTHFNCQSAL